MSNIGRQLDSPDSGWVRFQEDDNNIQYIGNFENGYGCKYTNDMVNKKIIFNFTGSGIRLLGRRAMNRGKLFVNINKNLTLNFSQENKNLIECGIDLEFIGLANTEHSLEIYGTGAYYFNAVDLLQYNSLKPYNTILDNPFYSGFTLIKSNNHINTIKNNILIYPNIKEPLTKNDFYKYGMNNLSNYNNEINKVSYEMEENVELEIGCRIVRKKINKNDFGINKLYTGKILSSDSMIITPIMTSDNTPQGIVTTSSTIHLNNYAWHVFDRNYGINGTNFVTSDNVSFIQYEFDSSKIITKYALIGRNKGNYPEQTPKSWTFQGSRDGLQWVDLDIQTNQTKWLNSERREFNINNPDFYKYYRLNNIVRNGDNFTSIGGLELLSEFVYNKFKILIKSSGKIYYLNELNMWEDTKLQEPLTKEDFEIYGMDNLTSDEIYELDGDIIEIIACIIEDKNYTQSSINGNKLEWSEDGVLFETVLDENIDISKIENIIIE